VPGRLSPRELPVLDASSNPFAGVSLSSPAPAAGIGLFAAAAAAGFSSSFLPTASASASASASAPASAPASASTSTAFEFGSVPESGGNGFMASSSSGSATAGSQGANPFMGLSLFSSAGASTSASAAAASTSNSSQASPVPGTAGDRAGRRQGVNDSAPVTSTPAAGSAASNTVPVKSPANDQNAVAGLVGSGTGDGVAEDEEVIFRAEGRLVKLVRQERAATGGGNEAEAGVESPDAEACAETVRSQGSEAKGWRWQERGCGVVHVHRHRSGAGRLVMRMRGVLKLLLNTPVFPTTKYDRVGQKSVRFVGVDTEQVVDGETLKGEDAGAGALCAYRLSFQSGDQQSKFLNVLRDLSCVPGGAPLP